MNWRDVEFAISAGIGDSKNKSSDGRETLEEQRCVCMPRGRDWTSDGHNGDAVEQGVGEAADLWVALGPEVATCGWRRDRRWRRRRWGGNGVVCEL
ncbi:unnamed protein product [Camellia sinensis]